MKRSLSFCFVAYAVLITLDSGLLSAQVKIYVNTDLEGISGVFKWTQTREKDTPLNIQACEYFMGDVAAVVRGLRDGGATEIVILDGHGSQAVLPHLMIPGAKYLTGTPRPGAGSLTELDSSFAGMVFVGFHAMKEFLRSDQPSGEPVLVTREGIAENALHLFTCAKESSAKQA